MLFFTAVVKNTKILTPKIIPKFIKNTKKIFTTPKKTPNLVLTPKCSEKACASFKNGPKARFLDFKGQNLMFNLPKNTKMS